MCNIHATYYSVEFNAASMNQISFWHFFSKNICDSANGKYSVLTRLNYKIIICSERAVSPCGRLIRYKTLAFHFTRRSSIQFSFEVSVENFFTDDREAYTAADLQAYENISAWINFVSKTSLSEHLRHVFDFLGCLDRAGFNFTEVSLTDGVLPFPDIISGYGTHNFLNKSFRKTVQRPLELPSRWSLSILGRSIDVATQAQCVLRARLDEIFPFSSCYPFTILRNDWSGKADVHLIILDKSIDLATNSKLLEILITLESRGLYFKIINDTSLFDKFSSANIAFDLCMLAGCVLWRPGQEITPALGLDAGHDTKWRRSRWIRTESDVHGTIRGIKILNSKLAEHIPNHILTDIIHRAENMNIFRDGRLSQERLELTNFVHSSSCKLFEVKKNSKALLYRLDGGAPLPVSFGEYAVDPYGDILVQTTRQNPAAYMSPLRITPDDQTGKHACLEAFASLYLTPSISLFNQPRLPGVLYWADMASKYRENCWAKVVGRGFGLTELIPKPN